MRGFHEKDPEARELLETIGRVFLAGYGHAAETRTPAEADERLERVPTRFRGFAYEGAAMALAIMDAMSPRGGRFRAFLAGPGDRHVYMAYVGAGWAMARLPRPLWPRLHAPDPLLRWLVLDGYGFHQAYFKTDRYVHRQHREDGFPWPRGGPADYAARVIDQGVGRAMWFVAGADADLAATMIEKFPERRRADLYAGAGLAATYAGGADETELRGFWARAGEHRPYVAQGCAFAAEARHRAGLVVPHNELATRVFCDMTVAEAAAVNAEVRPDPAAHQGDLPAYEIWRQAIADRFVSLGRC